MDMTRSKRLFTLALAALFLSPALPVAAEASSSPPGEIDLGLAAVVSLSEDDAFAFEIDLGGAPIEELPGMAVEVASLDSAAVRELWLASESSAEGAASQGAADKKWFKKKKKWWVPLVAAVVVGAVLSDDGSDSPDDID